MSLKLFDTVPDFTQDSTEGQFHFYDWAGDDWVVIFSHPKDFTPVCTTELGSVARLKPEFDKRGVKVVGLSVDAVESHHRPECQAEAADLLAAYIQDHRLRATGGDTKRAVGLMRESLKPEKGPDGASGWTEFALPWNKYIKATIAFLNEDKRGLKRARSAREISDAGGVRKKWIPRRPAASCLNGPRIWMS